MNNTEYIRYMKDMMATQGWSMYIEECQKEIYQLQADALEAKVWDEVLLARGRAIQLAQTVALDSIIDAMEVEQEMNDADV